MGYGTVNMKGVFDNIRSVTSELKVMNENVAMEENEYYIGNLFIRLPN